VSAAGETGKSVSLRALERVFSMAVAIELRNRRVAFLESVCSVARGQKSAVREHGGQEVGRLVGLNV
jgi:hypothetical protein